MTLFTEAHILAPTLLLIVASLFDLKSGKFPNWLFIVSFAFGLLWLAGKNDLGEFMMGLGSAILVFIALAPLVFMKAFGAGDVKLMTSFCLFTDLKVTGFVLLYSLFWGLLLGLLRMAVAGELKLFTQSFFLRTPQAAHQKIPYTFALLLGWFSLLTVGGLA